jgi:hypothetical protein
MYHLIYSYYLGSNILDNFANYINVNDLNNTGNKSDITLESKIILDKEAGAEIAKGVSNLGNNIGLAGCVGAMAGGVSSTIAKSSLPPVQKVGLVLMGGIVGAALHIGASSINSHRHAKYLNKLSSVNESNILSSKDINKFIDSVGNNSPLELLLQCICALDFVCI